MKRRIIFTRVAKSLIKNPLLVSPAIAICIPLSGLTVPDSINVFLKLLGGAASPCALIALGLFLAGQSDKRTNNDNFTVTLLVVLKLLIQPALTWWFATKCFTCHLFWFTPQCYWRHYQQVQDHLCWLSSIVARHQQHRNVYWFQQCFLCLHFLLICTPSVYN